MKVRSLFFSDLHLGSRACNADLFLDIIKYYKTDYIIINGDFIDFWQMGITNSWSKKHNDVLRLLFKVARDGTKIIITIGNHDEILRQYAPFSLDNVIVTNEYVFDSVKYGEILFIHGDAFDCVIKSNPWLARFGAILYEGLISFNHYFNVIRRRIFGLDYWSLSKYLKTQTKKRFVILQNFDRAIVEYAKTKKYKCVAAGHIHIPEMRIIDDVMYLNTGDMCETGSFIIEHLDGELELVTRGTV
jgi:UDP-2,3-diacylglucosamine pyrophosphatase LpxH